MRVRRTFDLDLVRRIHLPVWVEASDPLTIRPEEFEFPADHIYLLAPPDKGIWWLHGDEKGLRIHVATSPECRGKAAVEGSRQAFGWAFENTDADRIVARIWPHKKHVRVLAALAGMIYTGNEDGRAVYEVERWAV